MVEISSFQTKLTYEQLIVVDEYWRIMQFTSRNEFVRQAIRFYMEKHKPPKKVEPNHERDEHEPFPKVN